MSNAQHDERIDQLKRAYPNESDFIEALRNRTRTELTEQVVLYYRDACRLYAGSVKP
jgi:hypothetical protein